MDGKLNEPICARCGPIMFVQDSGPIVGLINHWQEHHGGIPAPKLRPLKWFNIGRGVLTPAVVAEVRRLYAAGGVTYSQLAKRYGVDDSTIGYAVKGRTWKGVSA